MCGRRCSQLRLLLWKNWILKKRRFVSTLFEILVPLFAIIILMLIRYAVKIDDVAQTIPAIDSVRPISSDIVPMFGMSLACGVSLVAKAPLPSVEYYGSQQIALAHNLIDTPTNNYTAQLDILSTRIKSTILSLPPSAFPCNINSTEWAHHSVRIFKNENELNQYIQQDQYGVDRNITTIALGVVFNSMGPDWSYTLRANSSEVPWTGTTLNNLLVGYKNTIFFQYLDSHVLNLKYFVDAFIFDQSMPSNASLNFHLDDISLIGFPVPAHKQDNFGQQISSIIGLFLVAAFMWPFSRMVRNQVEEKERRIAEGLSQMGLGNSLFLISWAITYFIQFFILVILVTIFTHVNLFPRSNALVIFFYFFSFSMSILSLACLLSAFFVRAKTAGTISPFFLLCLYLPYFSVSGNQKSESIKNLSCLLSPVAFSLGATNILSFESAFIGSQSDNLNELVDNFRLITAISLMFFDAILYGALAWYLDLVWPKDYGTQLPWYFPITPSFWKSCLFDCFCCCCSSDSSSASTADNGGNSNAPTPVNRHDIIPGSKNSPSRLRIPLLERASSPENHMNGDDDDLGPDVEAVPESLRSQVGIRVRKLKKQFPGANDQLVTAVNGLNLNMYKGQIFVLLGHNGAGKTTTLNMLMGSLQPSEGTAYIGNRDIRQDMDTIRRTLGVCPQHDVLFDDLTVEEHLELFARLKGVAKERIPMAVKQAIQEVQLQMASKQLSSTLSGGQKRRLSLAIALIGDSSVVFLDEPTSGVDPFSRRAIWDLLVHKKAGRTIILTTHFMDEADQLGDRIAIMSSGKLKCCGTSLFLKRKFGVGYCMTLTKADSQCDQHAVTSLLKKHVANVEVLSSVGAELSYRLPIAASTHFPALLQELDNQLLPLHITNYGLSVTTLEEVFIKVAQETHDNDADDRKDSMDAAGRKLHTERQDSQKELEVLESAPSAGSSFVFGRHFCALLKKRANVTKRDKKAACCQILVPLILLSLGLGLLRIPPDFDFPNLQLTPNEFNQPDFVPYNSDLYAGIRDNVKDGVSMEFFSNGSNPIMFSYDLLDNQTHKESRYGAFYNNPGESTDLSNFRYTIFNNITALHGLPIWMNVAHSALLRSITKNSSISIDSSIHPFSWTPHQKSVIQSINGIFASIVISFAFAFIPASYAVFVVAERESKSKHLQLISGVSIPSYWLSNYLWDIVSFSIPTAISVLIILAFGNPNFVGPNFPVVVLTFIMFGIAVIPFTYLLSFLFSSHSTAQNVMILLYLLGGTILTMVSFALHAISSTEELNDNYLRHLFRLLPNFCLSDAIFWLSARDFYQFDKWDLFVTGYDLIFLAWESVVYFLLTLMVEYLSSMPQVVAWFTRDTPLKDISGAAIDPNTEDVDVRTERERITAVYGDKSSGSIPAVSARLQLQSPRRPLLNDSASKPSNAALSEARRASTIDDVICVQGLTKTYGKKAAVRDVFFGIPAGQCFGFLGVNGAGKSTTLKMLTGDLLPTSGTATLGGFDIIAYPQVVRRLMGYCPQFDALHDLLTGEETLEFYGRLRGIPESRLKQMVGYLIDRLTLRQYAKRPAGTYSGGNKRKLSVAIALIGNPKVVFLDEPSSGMDPVSRRFMWDFISETMVNRSVILTTHSMEECEALCQRIGILVSGALKCLGTAQHLKNRFGRGFQVDITTAGNDIQPVQAWIRQQYPFAQVVEAYGGKLKIKIPQPQPGERSDLPILTLRSVFATIESVKDKVGISEYSVGQTTLEQIFIYFARQGAEWAEGNGQGGQPQVLPGGVPMPDYVPRNLPRISSASQSEQQPPNRQSRNNGSAPQFVGSRQDAPLPPYAMPQDGYHPL